MPYVSSLGPAWLRERVVEILPYAPLQRLKGLVDVMAKQSSEIFLSKKSALTQGDEVVVQRIGEGRDIMSILSTFSYSMHILSASISIMI